MPSFDVFGQPTDDDPIPFAGPDQLVLHGFVNAHSHAFQRALRGRVENRPPAALGAEQSRDDFWSWRTAMYADAAKVSPDDVEALATWAYADMVRSGFTTVGEFHYLHHDVDGAPYAQPEMSLALARAARTVGIRLMLLETAYARGGVDKPLTSTQRRFAFPAPDTFLAHVDRVRGALADHPEVHVGLAIHSVRACPRDWIEEVALRAAALSAPLHVHACEQRKELDECRFEHGLSPIALLLETGALSPSTTIVHGTHVEASDIAHMESMRPTVCVTPSTERNLGDGLCPILDLQNAGVDICIGTDSHARIDLVDELRSLEDHERLRTERRNVLLAPGQRLHDVLIPCGARNGLLALDLLTDDSVAGDRVAIAMPIEGRAGGASVGLDAWLVGGSGRDVRKVRVGQRLVVDDGKLVGVDEAEVEAKALAVLAKLTGSTG